MQLVTLANTKAWLNVSVSTYDTLITTLIESAEEQLKDRCNRPLGFGVLTATEQDFDGENWPKLQLSYTPITSVASVTLDDVAIASTAYAVDLRTGLLSLTDGVWNWRSGGTLMSPTRTIPTQPYRGRGFPDGFRNVAVTYTGGYATIPSVLTEATYRLVEYSWIERGSSGLSQETLGSYAYARNAEGRKRLWDDIMEMIGSQTLADPGI